MSRVYVRVPAETRFWQKVNKTETCWLWTASTTHFGYGQFLVCGEPRKMLNAHRFSWELHNGPIPDGLWVLHHCDNPLCVRPDHLWLGTARENSLDAQRKDRSKAFRRRTHCPKGHPYDTANTLIRTHKDGHTQQCCRQCMNDATRRWYHEHGGREKEAQRYTTADREALRKYWRERGAAKRAADPEGERQRYAGYRLRAKAR